MSNGDEFEFDASLPEDAIQDASDAFALFGYEFNGDSVHSMSGDYERGEDSRLVGFSSAIEALNYWQSDGWQDVPDFAELYYDADDGVWYWEIRGSP